ncbi:PD-(D/E)XK nuclease family protein [Gemmatimonadota bacterium]
MERADLDHLVSLEDDLALLDPDLLKPRFSILRAIGQGRDELTHSRMLAALFDSSGHRAGANLARGFLHEVAKAIDPDYADLALQVTQAAGEESFQVTPFREYRHIDCVLRIYAGSIDLAVGIENKVDAQERDGQLGDYQKVLPAAFPNQFCLIVFLSPTGRAPDTHDPKCESCPVVSMGYDTVASVLRAQVGDADGVDSGIRNYLLHLEEEIVGTKEQKNKVRELWISHHDALELAVRLRPSLKDIKGQYENQVRGKYPKDAVLWRYPEKGDPREIKLKLESWVKAGFPFTFMLFSNRGGLPADRGLPAVRVFISCDDYERNRDGLNRFASRVNGSGKNGLIDENFPVVKGWPRWRRVFAEEDFPPDAYLKAIGWDEGTVEEAVKKVSGHIEELRPGVDSA